MQAIIFDVAGQRYGLPLPVTREIFQAVEVTPVAGAPGVIEGVVDVRGELCPVMNLRRRFGLAASPEDPAHHLVQAAINGRTVLLRVDRALDIADIQADQVQDILEVLPRAGHIAGVARLPDGMVLIADLDAFLTEAESEELDEALLAISRMRSADSHAAND